MAMTSTVFSLTKSIQAPDNVKFTPQHIQQDFHNHYHHFFAMFQYSAPSLRLHLFRREKLKPPTFLLC